MNSHGFVLDENQTDFQPEFNSKISESFEGLQIEPQNVKEETTFDFNIDFTFNISSIPQEKQPEEKLNFKSVLIETIKLNLTSYEFIPQSLKDDEDVITQLLIQNEKEYPNLPEKHQRNKSIILQVVKKNQKIYPILCLDLKKDEEIINEFLENKGSFYFVPEEKKNKKSITLKAMVIDGSQLRFCPPEFQNDFDIVKEAFIQNRFSIDHIGDKIKKSKEFALYVVESKPLDLQYFDDEIRGDHDVVLKAIKKDKSSICFLPPSALSDKELAMKVVSIHGTLINRFSKEILNDLEVQKKAVETDGNALMYFHGHSETLIEIALQQNPASLRYIPAVFASKYLNKLIVVKAIKSGLESRFIPPEYFEDFHFALEAVSVKGNLYREITNQELLANEKIIKAAVKSNSIMLDYIPKEYLSNFEFAKEMIEHDHQNWQYFHEVFSNNREIAEIVLPHNGRALFNLSTTLQDDEELVSMAVSQNGTSLLFASERLKSNEKFVKKMLKSNPELLYSCPKIIQENLEFILFARRMYPELYLNVKIKNRLFDMTFHFEGIPGKLNNDFEFDFNQNEFNFPTQLPLFDQDDDFIDSSFGIRNRHFNFSISPATSKTVSPSSGSTKNRKRTTPKKNIVTTDLSDETFLTLDQMSHLEESLEKYKQDKK